MGDKGSRSRSIIQFMFIILCIFFIQTIVIPFLLPSIMGTPTSWIVVGIGTVFMWMFIKFLLYNVKRERTVL